MDEHPPPNDDLRSAFSGWAEQLHDLHERALRDYTPLVEGLLASACRDAGTIERTLDGLLDFCGDRRVLNLYRRLCRHYWPLDPWATARYIEYYREAYDPAPESPESSDLA